MKNDFYIDIQNKFKVRLYNMSVRIIVDSTTDVTPEIAEKYHLGLVPLKVIFDKTEFRDRFDLSVEEFYQRLASSSQLPTTSQPSPNDFVVEYEKAIAEGEDIVMITISSQLSGTYQSACLARTYCEHDNIYVVDSLQATIGTQLLLKEAIRLRDEGKSAREIAEFLEEIKGNISILAIVDTLEYLVKGGRLSKAAGFAGSLLGIHPVITLQDGKIEVLGKARGKKATMELVWKELVKRGMPDSRFEPIFGYTGHASAADDLIRYMNDKGISSSYLCSVGSVIGTHTGPGVCAIAYIHE